ncbi:hypothetical protein TNCV_1087981 [Trichonephila clavipes]|uniref:Uncharacterized protein n=1 Tax=Trichonephila clavipes TaxID=2585209 RepID=A0A8X6SP42_TRICX|nr:hypothetical protein TNCV_1087981 [Trichonephila clavipes]
MQKIDSGMKKVPCVSVWLGCSRQNSIPKNKFRIGRAQMPLSREETGDKTTCGNWYHLNGAALKMIPTPGDCTRSAKVEIPIRSPIRG